MHLAIVLALILVASTAPAGAAARPSTARAITADRQAEPPQAGPRIVRIPGHVLDLSSYTPLPDNPAASEQPLSITVTLNRTDQAGFEAYLAGLADPASPYYQHVLSQQEIADRFGPSQDAYDAVIGYVESYGFQLQNGATNRLTATFSGTRGEAERAFHVTIRDYQAGDRTFYANDDDPGVPASIAPYIMAIEGLSNLAIPRPG